MLVENSHNTRWRAMFDLKYHITMQKKDAVNQLVDDLHCKGRLQLPAHLDAIKNACTLALNSIYCLRSEHIFLRVAWREWATLPVGSQACRIKARAFCAWVCYRAWHINGNLVKGREDVYADAEEADAMFPDMPMCPFYDYGVWDPVQLLTLQPVPCPYGFPKIKWPEPSQFVLSIRMTLAVGTIQKASPLSLLKPDLFRKIVSKIKWGWCDQTVARGMQKRTRTRVICSALCRAPQSVSGSKCMQRYFQVSHHPNDILPQEVMASAEKLMQDHAMNKRAKVGAANKSLRKAKLKGKA